MEVESYNSFNLQRSFERSFIESNGFLVQRADVLLLYALFFFSLPYYSLPFPLSIVDAFQDQLTCKMLSLLILIDFQ